MVTAVRRAARGLGLAAALGLALAGCQKKEVTLPGVRLSIDTPVGGAAEAAGKLPAKVPALRLPAPRDVVAWTHRAGGPDHRIPNATLSAAPRLAWSASIGSGQGRRSRISADPVSDGVRVYTIDSSEHLVATTLAGARVWSLDLTPQGEGEASTSGAGLAVSRGTVYATSAFSRLYAIDAATGAVRWTQDLGAVPSGPPTVSGKFVYLVTRDNTAWAIDTATGRVRWQVAAQSQVTGFGSGAAPAVGKTLAIFPFSSGELIALLRQSGVRLWSGAVSGERLGRVYAQIGDITADPAIVGSRVYTGTQAGRLVALSLNTGDRIWTADTGVQGPVLAAGNSLWIVTDENRLERLDAASGRTLWSRQLPYFRNEKPRKRRGIYVNYGPILAGGRLWVAGSDGLMRSFDPATGAPGPQLAIPDGATAAPIVVRRTLFVVTRNGDLLAFR